jgi:flagellar biosynthesis anti-sigma factor FlgM
MRIDLNHGPQAASGSNQGSAPSPTAVGSPVVSSALGEDQAQLSGAHAHVQALATQASQLPEVRQERVPALRHAVESGQYQASPDEVAGALLAHLIAQRAA